MCLLQSYLSVFVLNGYEDLDSFADMDESELDYLGIEDQRHRAKIMTAVEIIQDYAGKRFAHSFSPTFDPAHVQSNGGTLAEASATAEILASLDYATSVALDVVSDFAAACHRSGSGSCGCLS